MLWKRLLASGLLLAAACFIVVVLRAQTSNPDTWPIVYEEYFEDPERGWNIDETKHVKRAYVEGAYEIQVKDDWRTTWSRIPGDRVSLDFSAEVKVTMVEGIGQFGFLFRYVNGLERGSGTLRPLFYSFSNSD